MNDENKVIQIKLDDIIPNRFQPREVFDESGLEELAESIKEHGVIQPVIVRKLGDKFELIAGERRTKASAIAGKTTIPGIVRDMDDRESAKVSLLENLQRKNLSAIEEAKTYKRILELENMTQEELARTMGRSQPMVANKLRLLSLPEEVQEALMKNQISERHARSLLTIQDKKDQLEFLERIKKERLTVRELDSEIKKYKNEKIENNEEEDKERFMNNNRSNFGGMGLNDYQSGVNNMFNNIPNNFSNTNTGGMGQDLGNNTDLFNNQDIMSNNNDNSTTTSSLGLMLDGGVESKDMIASLPDDTGDNNLFVSQIRDDNSNSTNNQFLPNFDMNDNINTGFDNFGVNNNFNNPIPQNNYFNSNQNSMNDINMYQQPNFTQPMSNNMFNGNEGMPLNNGFNQMDNMQYQNNNFNDNMNLDYNQPFTPMGSNISTPQQTNNGNFNVYGNQSFGQNEMYQQDLNNMNNNNSMNMNNQFNNPNMQGNSIPDFGMQTNINMNPNNGSLFNQPLNIVGSYGMEETPKEMPNTEQNQSLNNEFNSNNMVSNTPINNTMDIKPEQNNSVLSNEMESTKIETPIETSSPEANVTNNIPDLEIIGDVNPSVQNNKSQIENKNEYIRLEEEITIHNVKDAVMELKKTTDKIKQNHINIETEEIDFDDVYQITIKIKKENI